MRDPEALPVAMNTKARNPRSAIFSAGIMVFALAGTSSVHAARTIDSVTLSYSTQINVTTVSVLPGATLSATVTVTTTGGSPANRWRATSWRIGGGAFTCVDHADNGGAGTFTLSFNITAPAAAGTYNAEFIAYQNNGCAVGASPTFTLTGGVIVETTPPTVSSINRAGPSPTGAASVSWTVTFNENVIGVDAGDFTLVQTGVSGASITSVTGSGSVYTVTAGTGTGDGTLGLNLVDNDSITDLAGNALGGAGAGNGNFTGQVYTLTRVSSFNAVEPSANPATGRIFTKIAGQNFALDIVALDSGNALATGFTGTVAVEVVDSSSGGACGGLPLIAAFTSQTFTAAEAGRHPLTSPNSVANVYRDAKIRIKHPAGAPTIISCSSDNFAIRPSGFTVAVTDATWDTAGTARTLNNTGASGGAVHKAGRNFTITVTPSPGSATNYDGDPAVSALTCTLPGGCVNGTLGVGTFAGIGTRASSTATYAEAGAFNLTLVDQTFASVDSGDGTPADCSGFHVCQSPAPLAVGRFVPDRFDFTGANTPQFLTFGTAACASRSFTYIGQRFWYTPLLPSATVRALNAAGTVTANYSGALFKLDDVGVTGITETYSNNAVGPALDTTLIGTPTLTAGAGTGTYTAAAGGTLAYTRSTSSPIPAANSPFTANLSLTVNATDDSEAAVAGNGTITSPTPLVFNGGGSGIAFDAGAAFRYGRLRLGNANGSQLVPLPVMVETQYWGYTNPPANTVLGFILNTDDNCTSVASANVAMGNYTNNLTDTPTCETAVSAGGTFSSGRRTLRLAAPGAANNGSVVLTVNLGTGPSGNTCTTVGVAAGGATTANRPYLQGNWTGGNFDQNPAARASFGLYRGAEEVIFIRENFQ